MLGMLPYDCNQKTNLIYGDKQDEKRKKSFI